MVSIRHKQGQPLTAVEADKTNNAVVKKKKCCKNRNGAQALKI